MTARELIPRMLKGWSSRQWGRQWHRCIWGRAIRCCPDAGGGNRVTDDLYLEFTQAFRRATGRYPGPFNDDPRTTFDDVVEALKKTKAKLEATP